MLRLTLPFLSTLLALPVLSPGAQAVASPEASVDPAVTALVEAWGDRHASLGDRRIRVLDTFDEVRPDGQKIQYAHVRTVTVSPPNRLRIESRGDVAHRTIVYDGRTATLADHDLGTYGQIEFEGTVEEMVDHLFSEYGVSMPLADFLSADPAADLMEGVVQAQVIGTGLVGEMQCVHVACREDAIDWQAWFGGEADAPLLLRMVITQKLLPLAPQYTLQLLESEQIEATDEDFAFDPTGLERLEFDTGTPAQASGTEE